MSQYVQKKNIKKCGVRFASEIRFLFLNHTMYPSWAMLPPLERRILCYLSLPKFDCVLSTRKLSDDLQAPPSNALCSPLAPHVCLAGRSCKRTCVTIGVRCRWRLMIRCKGNGRYSYSQWKPTTMFMCERVFCSFFSTLQHGFPIHMYALRVFSNVPTDLYIQACLHTCIPTCLHADIHTYFTYIHTCIHAYIYAYTRIPNISHMCIYLHAR